ncbi:tail fiber assembly protein [Pseudomonas sp. MWU13-3659]|uniref:tail fiber assembly protein n=1 Tax=Pseudomonas sp. MWU13-3659 TaxID=2986964 RepID=UPI00256F11FD|nr:tail fiber assembly protein [Pseudomonas sp. MWU13-3659]
MRIKLLPIMSSARLVVFRDGDELQINGQRYDFSRVTEGATLPGTAIAEACVFGPVERIGGVLDVTLLLPHADDAPESVRFPVDIINPSNGVVHLPGQNPTTTSQVMTGVIDWSQMVTAEQKAAAAAAQVLAEAVSEIALRRAKADQEIAPLQDAVDIDDATQAEAALLKDWKRYRVALNRLPEQAGYPATIDWPAPPA